MKKDIESRKDIEVLVNRFYDRVKTDPVIGYIFTDLVKVNWEDHLPKMYEFWENALFYTGSYTGNPLRIHMHLHHMFPLTSQHFLRWNQLFNETVDLLFSGERARLAKQRAKSISSVMQLRILNEGNLL